VKFSEELKITCINSSDSFSKAKKNRFLKKREGMVEGEHCSFTVFAFGSKLCLQFRPGEILSCDPLANFCTFLCIDLFLFDEWYHVAAFLNLMCLCCQAIGWA